jgi:hypothetical protein
MGQNQPFVIQTSFGCINTGLVTHIERRSSVHNEVGNLVGPGVRISFAAGGEDNFLEVPDPEGTIILEQVISLLGI